MPSSLNRSVGHRAVIAIGNPHVPGARATPGVSVAEMYGLESKSFVKRRLRDMLVPVASVLLTWKVLFFEQDCQTGQDCRARNRFVLRNRPSLPVWLRPSGRAVRSCNRVTTDSNAGRVGWERFCP